MRIASLLFLLGLLALMVFGPPVLDPPTTVLRQIDNTGADTECPPDFARLVRPDRTKVTPWALLDDAAYCVADAGALGTAGILLFLALIPLILGLWCEGVLCGLRRVAVTFALGLPICIGLAWASCFLEGRAIRLAPRAAAEYVSASLHTQTNHSTGLLSPANLLQWHAKRGFAVINVSDKDTDTGAREAQELAIKQGLVPELLVLRGEEWHGRPDIVLVNVKHAWDPDAATLQETINGVRREGGATVLAHPWSKLGMPLDQVLGSGIDGVEAVNGVIHGGQHVLSSAARQGVSIIGSLDYKFGPHVNAVTLIRSRFARTPAGVVRAIREGHTRVLYAIPGGGTTGAAWKAGRPGLAGIVAGVRTLYVAPHRRRAVWYGWLVFIVLLWRLATRERENARRITPSMARFLFLVCCAVEFALPAALGWQVREVTGPLSMKLILCIAALFAVPLLAASHELGRLRRTVDDDE